MLLQPTKLRGADGKAIFEERMRRFLRGEWLELLEESTSDEKQHVVRQLDAESIESKLLDQAEMKIKLREVSKARMLLTSNGIAPGNEETLRQLTDPALRPRVPQEAIPRETFAFSPAIESLQTPTS